MFQTMEGNARPHRAADSSANDTQRTVPAAEAELMHTLQLASDNIMRLAGKLRSGRHINTYFADVARMDEQHELAQQAIGRLLTLPASHA